MRLLLAMVVAGALDAGAPAPRYEDAESSAVLSVVGGKATIAVQAKGRYHLNGDYPINFVPADGSAKVTKAQMAFKACADHKDEQCAATVPVPLPGKGMLAFAVCDPDICLIKKVAVAP